MIKALLKDIYERVVLAYKSTLIGAAIAVGIVVADAAMAYLTGYSAWWAAPLAGLVALFGAALKKQADKYPQPVPTPPAD
jgi:hypothetical protein